MIETNSVYYLQTGIFYEKKSELEEFIKNKAEWIWIPYQTTCKDFGRIAEEYKDTFIKELDQNFDGELRLYKFPPKCMYTWHADTHFDWAINLVLEQHNCHTFFSDKKEHETPNGGFIYYYLNELKYNSLEWTIFNTKISHCICNYGDTDRILLTYRTPPSRRNNIVYKDVVSWFETRQNQSIT